MPSLPTGTVTFLFTDIEGSTRLLQQLGDRYAEVLATHRRLLRNAIDQAHGHVVDIQGDALFAAFPRARDALLAAIAAQRSVQTHPWSVGIAPKVRVGLHTGEPVTGETGYVGMDVHRAARIAVAGHGGQILVSDVTHGLVARDLPEGVSLRDLGEHRLKDLAHPHRLFQVLAPDLPSYFPPPQSLDAHPHNLPIELTSFIGRAREIAEVKRLLGTARLVTLTGSGGVGKTRLALQVAADVVEGYPDGVWLAEYAPIADPALVPKTVASALSVPEQPGREKIETLGDALRPKALLLVLDNCEHLLAACADLAAALLRACPQVHILATSREGLGVPGETLWRVPSLSLPDPRRLPVPEDLTQYEAVRLFVDRAMATAPGFTVTRENAPAVAQVCQQLDGIPLAIELAAARVKVLAVEQIAVRLVDRFRLLTGGSRMLVPRHQTLRAAIDWSYHLLSEPERTLLRQLSVFAGGCSLAATEAVCAGQGVEAPGVLDLLTSLVDKSLVLAEIQRGEARYRLLETLRQYGRDRLVESGEAAAAERRHRDYYLSFAKDAEPNLNGPQQAQWLGQLEQEHDNLRAAIDWTMAEQGGADPGLQLGGALWWFWWMRGHVSEGRQRLNTLLSRPDAAARTVSRARALYAAGVFANIYDEYSASQALLEDSLAIYREQGNKRGMAEALLWLGIGTFFQNDHSAARAHWEEGIALWQEIGDDGGRAEALAWLALMSNDERDGVAAEALATESVRLCRAVGNRNVLGWALTQLGFAKVIQGSHAEARPLFDEGLALQRELGSGHFMAYALAGQGLVLMEQGDLQAARRLLAESLLLLKDVPDKMGIAFLLEFFAYLSATRGLFLRAARLIGAARAIRRAIGNEISVDGRFRLRQALKLSREALDEAAFELALTAGQSMTLDQAIEYALQEASDSPQ